MHMLVKFVLALKNRSCRRDRAKETRNSVGSEGSDRTLRFCPSKGKTALSMCKKMSDCIINVLIFLTVIDGKFWPAHRSAPRYTGTEPTAWSWSPHPVALCRNLKYDIVVVLVERVFKERLDQFGNHLKAWICSTRSITYKLDSLVRYTNVWYPNPNILQLYHQERLSFDKRSRYWWLLDVWLNWKTFSQIFSLVCWHEGVISQHMEIHLPERTQHELRTQKWLINSSS